MVPGLTSSSLAVCVFLASLVRLEAAAPDFFAGWPQSWVAACERFEAYNVSREQLVPSAGLDISPKGKMTTQVAPSNTLTERIGLDVFSDGNLVLETTVATLDLGDSGRRSFVSPATYTAALKSAGSTGYQYYYPFVRFEITDFEEPDGSGRLSSKVRQVSGPQTPESVWPNERIFRFLDFHIFPSRNLSDIYVENSKVTPNITLRVDNAGLVTRNTLEAPLESLLRWRVYRNGKLIKQDAAGGVARWEVGKEWGSYQVLIGVDCPKGFMPVSNLLTFPLFPTSSGGVCVFPRVTNIERFPDFLLDILSQDTRTELMAMEISREMGYYNTRSVYFLSRSASFGDRKKDVLFRLWHDWGHELAQAIGRSDGVLGRTINKP